MLNSQIMIFCIKNKIGKQNSLFMNYDEVVGIFNYRPIFGNGPHRMLVR